MRSSRKVLDVWTSAVEQQAGPLAVNVSEDVEELQSRFVNKGSTDCRGLSNV